MLPDMDFEKHGTLLGMLALAALKALESWNRRKEKEGDGGKKLMLEDVSKVMQAHLDELKEIRSENQRMLPFIAAVDPETNFPRIWEDRKLHQEIQEDVKILGEAIGEQATRISEIHKQVGA